MTTIGRTRVVVVRRFDEHYLNEVQNLFAELYSDLGAYGKIIPLAEDGAEKWRKAVEPTLNSLGLLLVAVDDEDHVVGFIHSTLLLLPEYLDNHRAVRIQNAFIEPDFRGHDIASDFFAAVRSWAEEKGARSMEAQPQFGNERSIRVWERFGFQPEVLQLRLMLGEASKNTS